MTEEPEDKAPRPDKGLLYWVDLVRKPIAAQAGVEILDPDRAPFRFRFRGQVFQVTIAAVDK